MDPIAHTFVGAALSQTGLGRKSAYASAALVLGANLPDVDGLAMLAGGDAALFWRRGWTHGVPALVVLPFLLTGLLVVWSRAFGRRAPRPGVLLGLSALAVVTHPALDGLNTYGVRFLMPLDGRWFYGDTLFVVDPWFWLILGGALFLFHSRRLESVVAWAGFAGFTALLFFGLVPGLEGAKGLWCAAIAGLVVLRIRRVGFEERVARRLAVGVLAALALYLGVMHAAAREVRLAIAQTLAAQGVEVRKLMVGPRPVTPFVRDVVVETPDGYLVGEARLLPELHVEWAPDTLPLLGDSNAVRTATSSPEVRGFMHWARFPSAELEETSSGCRVILRDARYAGARAAGFGTARVDVPGPCGSVGVP